MDLKENFDIKNYFEILYNDSPNPCFISDIETHDVVFMNYAMKKILKESQNYSEEFKKSNKCFERMYGLNQPCQFCPNKDLVIEEFVESYVFNDILQKHFRVNNTKIKFKDRYYNQCKYFVTSSYTNQLITFEEAMTQSVQIFSENYDFEKMTLAFLELLGNFYECEFSFVAYLTPDTTQVTRQFNWSKENSKNSIDLSKLNLPLQKIITWVEQNSNDGIVNIDSKDNNSKASKAKLKLLKLFGVNNFNLATIPDENGKCIGIVGIANRVEKIFDLRLLKVITKFIKDGFTKSDMQKELKNISETDFLTGFYSRPRYANDIHEFKINPPTHLGVVLINLNGLRKTNEYMGYLKGDEQISSASDILRIFFGEPFYRISGDEFVCFCHDETEKQFIQKVNRLRNELKRRGDYPFAIGHVWKKGRIDVERLVSEADTVMFINKQEYYHSNHETSIDENNSMLNDLLNFIDDEEFLVYLQPQVRLSDGCLIGAEALIRRFDKSHNKMIFPDQFIPIYEKQSIIRHVDIYMIEKVCKLLKLWEESVCKQRLVPISVNLSRVTLIEFDIVNTIAAICDKYNISRDLLVIEITERIGLIENEVATTLIDEFKENGFKLSLDDFGCAYSNIVTLANITVDEVKIDKSLVDNLTTNPKNRIIVRNMVTMCNEFPNTNTLAEGIENQEQADILHAFGCSYGQGYHYDRPMPNEQFFDKYIIR